MFGSVVLDVAIGMAFVYLLLSLIASVVQELLAAFMQVRAANQGGLRSLFSGDSLGSEMDLVNCIYDHGLARFKPIRAFAETKVVVTVQTTDDDDSPLRLLIPSFPTRPLQQPIRRKPWTGLSSVHSEGSLIARVPGSLVASDFGGEDADVFDAAVALGVVHAVADDELVGDLEGYVVGFDGDEATLGFVEAGGDF
jgi:hypothetical protein